MKLKLNNFICNLEDTIKNNKIEKELDKEIITAISFFQHERFVHLLVTVFVGLSCILFLLGALQFGIIGLFLLFAISLILFIFYILHYYYLENGTQKLYDLYFEIKKATK